MKYKLLSIIILASVIRLVYLSYLPPSLNWDEVSIGYNAFSILKTGRDEWGVSFPTIFRAFGDYKLPVYVYATSISEFFLGITPFSVRLVSALSGIGLVFVTYFLAGEIFKRLFTQRHLQLMQILSTLLVAIEPWSLFLSRIAVEANLSILLIATGIWLLLKRKFPYAFICLGLSVWTYNSARVFVPFFLSAWVIIMRQEISTWQKNHRPHLILSGFIGAVFFLPMLFQLLMPQGQARFRWLSLLDDAAVNEINQSRSGYSSPILARIMHNKLTFTTVKFAKNYISYLSPNFLFFKGGSHYQFNIPGQGLMYITNMPFFIAGLIFILKNLKHPEAKLILAWLLISPIAGSLTKDSPHTLRAIVMLPLPMVLTGIGATWIAQRNRILIPLYLLVLLISFMKYARIYTYTYAVQYSWAWQYGYQEVIDFLKKNPQFNTIITTKKYGEPHEFFLYYLQYDPAAFITNQNLIRYQQSDWFWVDRFDKYWFLNDWQIQNLVTERGLPVDLNLPALLITSPGNFPSDWHKLKTIYFLDGSPAFDILEKT